MIKVNDIDHEEIQQEIQKKCECLVDDHHGQYIPQIFLSRYRDKLNVENMSDDDLDLLEYNKPNEVEFYWELWDKVLMNGKLTINDQTYTLAQNGDLFAVREDLSSEAWDMFYY